MTVIFSNPSISFISIESYVPELPDEVAIVLDNTAFIGHPDTIDSVNISTGMFKYYSAYGKIL